MILVTVCYADKTAEYNCDLVNVITPSGMIGIKYNHMDMVTEIYPEDIQLYSGGKIVCKIPVSSGMLRFVNKDNLCLITIMK